MGLGRKLVSVLSALIILLTGFTLVFFPARMESMANHWMERRTMELGLLLAHAAAPGVEFDDHQHVEQLLGALRTSTEVIFAAVYREDGTRLAAFNPAAAPTTTLATHQESVLLPFQDSLRLWVPVKTRMGEPGTLLLAMSTKGVDQEKSTYRWTIAVVALLILLLGLLATHVMARILVRPLQELTRCSGRIITNGDLTTRVRIDSSDEAGALAHSFQRMVDKLAEVLQRVARLGNEVANVIHQIKQTQDHVSRGMQSIGVSVRETLTLAAAIPTSLKTITEQVSTVHDQAVHSSGCIARMRECNRNVGQHVHSVTSSVAVIADASTAMTNATHQVVDQIDGLNAALRATSLSMTGMETAISSVDHGAKENARMTEVMRQAAERGNQTFRESRAVVGGIRDRTREAAKTLQTLGDRVSLIETLLESVTSTSDRTSSLAQNARLQVMGGGTCAGLSGTTDQIGEQAKRTRQVVCEVECLLQGIRENARECQELLGRCLAEADRQAAMGDETGRGFEQILTLARPCAQRAAEIACTSALQTQRTKDVARSIQHVANASDRIKKLTETQTTTILNVAQHVERLLGIAAAVSSATEQQSNASVQVTHALMGIGRISSQLKQVQQSQTRRAERVRCAVQEIHTIAEQQVHAVEDLGDALGTLWHQVETLRAEVQQFRLHPDHPPVMATAHDAGAVKLPLRVPPPVQVPGDHPALDA